MSKNIISNLTLKLLTLGQELTTSSKTDKIDIIALNTTDSPELKYNVITQGNLIYSVDPYQTLVEPQILNEYFDFRDILLRHKLTKAKI